ncbi:MAG TPA: hypothetical protein VFD60_01580 [Nitrososphaeraceae archaeon]|jgi:hypothetical protein|nr:hypothetical protein [Nitrososphaeraceae archaeon]
MINNIKDKDSSRKELMNYKYGNKFTSPEIYLEYNKDENDFYQAVIEFYGVDCTGPSYEGKVFVNNPDADKNTPLDEKNGYVGSYHIFGNDGCWGDKGHCEARVYRKYDSRKHSHIAPQYKFVDATKILKKYAKSKSKVKVTVLPRIGRDQNMSDTKDVVKCQRIRLTCYENPAELK